MTQCLESLVPTVDNYYPSLELFIKFTKSWVFNNYESPLVYNFKNFIFNKIYHFLSIIDFELSLNNNLSFEALVDKIYEIIDHSSSLFVSKIKINTDFLPMWANTEL